MGKTFVCSLCRNGIIGGGLYIDEQSITYSTQKLTVSPLYRNLVLPMNEIRELSWSQMVVPVAAISMKDGECYKFIIYNKSGKLMSLSKKPVKPIPIRSWWTVGIRFREFLLELIRP